MLSFVKNIRVNKVLHLQDFDINLGDQPKHLLITGTNGSGKTQLLIAIVEHLQLICSDTSFSFQDIDKNIENLDQCVKQASTEHDKASWESALKSTENQRQQLFGKVQLTFSDVISQIKAFNEGEFMVAFYKTFRNPKFVEVRSIEKPNLSQSRNVQESKVDQFLKFLADNKVQAALARNEGKFQEADAINSWFDSFRNVLRDIFYDQTLELSFDYKDYSFHIESLGKSFKFTELSAGYAASLDIVADLILKMQTPGSLTGAYNKSGIVVIDEPETHLHLSLQRQIMPILTRLFPNVQFIVATHSPFILSSLSNAVAFDLEQREVLEDLTEYSYGALAEGYFGVESESGVLLGRLDRLEQLTTKESVNDSEERELKALVADFDTISEAAAPAVKGRFLELKRKVLNRGIL